MKIKQVVKRILRKVFLSRTFCIVINGNQFRENDLLAGGKNAARIIVLRKELLLQNRKVVSKLYCVEHKIYRYPWMNKLRLDLYKWLALNDYIC